MEDKLAYCLHRFKEELDFAFEKAKIANDVSQLRYLNDTIIGICALSIQIRLQGIDRKFIS